MRRKDNMLTPIETKLLRAAVRLQLADAAAFYGWQLAKAQQDADGDAKPIGFGSLYRALDRMERFGYLTSRLEDAEIAEQERRPRRRLYTVTALGQQVLPQAEAVLAQAHAPRLRPAPGGLRP